MQSLMLLTNLSVVLVVGVLAAILAERLRIPRILALLIAGVVLGVLRYNNQQLITFPESFIVVMALLTLILVVFEGTSRIRIREVDKPSSKALKLVLVNIVLNLVLLTPIIILLFLHSFDIRNILIASSFSILASGTDVAAVFAILQKKSYKTKKWFDILKIESIINTPIVVVIPLIILEVVKNISSEGFVNAFITQLPNVVQSFVVGLGSGVFVGIIIIKALRHTHKVLTAQLGLLTAAIVTYVLSENFQGDGVIAVATLGIMFATVSMRHKEEIRRFNTTASLLFEIIVFTLLGLVIPLPKTGLFLFLSLTIFGVLLVIRLLSVHISLSKEANPREKLFLALESPKGIAVGVVTLSILFSNIIGVRILSSLILSFIIYSLVLSSIVSLYYQDKLLNK